MGQSKGKYVYFIFQQKKKVITWVAYVTWASFCCLGEYSWSRPDGFAASKNSSWFSLLSLYLVSSFLRHWILSSRAFVSCRLLWVGCLRHCLLGLVSGFSCLLSVHLRIFSWVSEPRLLEVGRAVRLHWRVRGFKLRALADRGNIMFCAKKKVTHVWIHLQARKSILGNSFYLKFELSLAMRGKAVMSTEKRWAL